MKIKLKETPDEWRKFTLQFCGLVAVLSGWIAWRNGVLIAGLPFLIGVPVSVSLAAWFRARWFRGFYRFGMIASVWLGARVGRVVLTVFFFVCMLPLGLILRLFGHDPLNLRKRPEETSYWRPVGRNGGFGKMY